MQAAVATVAAKPPPFRRSRLGADPRSVGGPRRPHPGPMVTFNRVGALAMAHGSGVGLPLLDTLANNHRANRSHRLSAVQARLLEMAGDLDRAQQACVTAARRTTSSAEVRYPHARAVALYPALTTEPCRPTPRPPCRQAVLQEDQRAGRAASCLSGRCVRQGVVCRTGRGVAVVDGSAGEGHGSAVDAVPAEAAERGGRGTTR